MRKPGGAKATTDLGGAEGARSHGGADRSRCRERSRHPWVELATDQPKVYPRSAGQVVWKETKG